MFATVSHFHPCLIFVGKESKKVAKEKYLNKPGPVAVAHWWTNQLIIISLLDQIELPLEQEDEKIVIEKD